MLDRVLEQRMHSQSWALRSHFTKLLSPGRVASEVHGACAEYFVLNSNSRYHLLALEYPMSSRDLSSDFHLSESGSRLLSESFLGPSSLRTGHGGDDLSLSELSIHDRPPPSRRKFSLFAQPPSPQHADESALEDEEEGEEGDVGDNTPDQTMRPEEVERAQRVAAKSREEKLQSDLYILKKLNAAFDIYKEALKETKSSTEVSSYLYLLCSEIGTSGPSSSVSQIS